MRVSSIMVTLCGLAIAGHAAPLKVCMVSGSFEYDSDTALGIFKEHLETRYDAACVLLSADGWENMPGLEALDDCDAALFFTRRLELPKNQIDVIKNYCAQGKPIVGIRTASHGFQPWLEMDKEVFGGDYQNHYGNGPTSKIEIVAKAKGHPILDGVVPFRSKYSLYKNPNIAADAGLLLRGEVNGKIEPVAWTRVHHSGRVFYCSFGGVEDFQNATFQRLIANALFWAAERDVAKKPLPAVAPRPKPAGMLKLKLRCREETGPGSGEWKETVIERTLPAAQAAILICDMWDQHWCTGAAERCGTLAGKMAKVIKAAHDAGVAVVHAPSDTMYYYDEWPQRRRAQMAPKVPLPESRKMPDPPLPIDDADGGCDTGNETQYAAWRRQHSAIPIGEFDIISDNGEEVYRYLEQEGINTLIIMGVHTNMCVLNRSFAIKQMTRWGKQCYLVRDLTDTMYNPERPPHVSHDEGTALVVEYIEKFWCPSLSSADLINGLPKKQAGNDSPPNEMGAEL